MDKPLNQTFLQQVNQHLGIAHKVARAYFDDKAEREDIIQEMMFQLWRSYANFNGLSKFSTWMYSVCLNTAMTYHRKVNKGAGEYLQEAHLEIAEKGNPEEEQLALMFQTIATLSPVNKAITLLYLEDLSYDEIARITGVSKANVSVRLVRIKNELEEKMKRLI
jgi:RNA polymerase sigma-70 factor (ECF subfamily)